MGFKKLLLTSFILLSSVFLLNAQTKIRYATFTLGEKPGKVTINWSTEASATTNYFVIQKSSDGINFETIALVLGPDPTKKNCQCFGCFDERSKKIYYRLVHIDSNGAELISAPKALAST